MIRLQNISEHLDTYTPGSFERFAELSVIQGQLKVPRAMIMMEELLEDNYKLESILKQSFESAGAEKIEGSKILLQSD